MWNARIIINDVCNDGQYTQTFLRKMYKMGATITVFAPDDKTLFLEKKEDWEYFKNLTAKGQF